MKLQNLLSALLLSIVLLGLPGCAHYRAKPLRTLKNFQITNEQSLSFTYKVFDVADCKKYLDRNTIVKGYQPIQITFMNNTDRYIKISPESFTLTCYYPQDVSVTVHTNTTKRVLGYGIAGLVFWPLLIPAVVDGIGSEKANQKLDIDFTHKSLQRQVVKPYSSINRLIFVSCEDYNQNFSLKVEDQKTNESFTLSTTQPKLII